MPSCLCAFFAAALVFVCVSRAAADIVIEPDADHDKSVFTYEFLPSTNMNQFGFSDILGFSETSTGHRLHTLIEFDLTGVALTGAEVAEATLNVYVMDGNLEFGGIFANPRADLTLDAQTYALGGPWNAATTTWNTEPLPVGDVLGTTTVDDVEIWIAIDVTQAVRDWLDGLLDNNGLLVRQRVQVTDPDSGLKLGIVLASAERPQRPYLRLIEQTPPACLCGDLDGNGFVNLIDFSTFSTCVGLQFPGNDVCPADLFVCADLSGDGLVNLTDFSTFSVLFGSPAAGSPPDCQ